MDERQVVLDQIQALKEQLQRAERAAREIDPALGDRVQAGFVEQFVDIGRRLANWDRAARAAGTPAELSQIWHNVQQMQQERCEPVFAECLALAQGALLRRAGLDEGLCDLADALVYDLSNRTGIPWGRFTVVDREGESFGQMVQVIRLRFPGSGVWDLPIVAHEFGHFVAPRLEERDWQMGTSHRPIPEILDRETRRQRQAAGGSDPGPGAAAHLEELFADLFATYVLGPAYACTCIVLRWDPWQAYADRSRHPSHARRVHWILRALEEMDENKGGLVPTFGSIIAGLRARWQQGLRLAGQPESLEARGDEGQQAIAQLEAWLREIYRAVGDNNKMAHARYREADWLRAQGLSRQLTGDRPPAASADDTLADVLNAAWYARFQHAAGDEAAQRRMAERALALCLEIVGRR